MTSRSYLEGSKEDIIFRAAIQYTDGYTENVFSYVNNIPTVRGRHARNGLSQPPTPRCSTISPRRLGALKDKDANLAGDDFREGMTAVMLADGEKSAV